MNSEESKYGKAFGLNCEKKGNWSRRFMTRKGILTRWRITLFRVAD